LSKTTGEKERKRGKEKGRKEGKKVELVLKARKEIANSQLLRKMTELIYTWNILSRKSTLWRPWSS
jgi:hypothetical protein